MTQEQDRNNRRVLRGLAAVLVAGTPGYVLVLQVQDALAELDPAPTAETVHWLAVLTSGGNLPESLGVPMGPAQEIEASLAPAWFATYLVAAASRLAEAERADVAWGIPGNALRTAMESEERYFLLHLAAEERRMRAAALQDMASLLNVDRDRDATKGLLGWRAVLDDRTTPECRYAHGRNFKADRMPEIGWPGAVHVHCRCSPGPAIPGAPLIPSV